MSLAWAMGRGTVGPGEGLGDIQQAWQVHTEPQFLIQSPGRVSWRWERGGLLEAPSPIPQDGWALPADRASPTASLGPLIALQESAVLLWATLWIQ